MEVSGIPSYDWYSFDGQVTFSGCAGAWLHLWREGAPPVRDIARQPYGRVAFAHSELEGGQYFGGAMLNARRAVEQVLART